MDLILKLMLFWCKCMKNLLKNINIKETNGTGLLENLYFKNLCVFLCVLQSFLIVFESREYEELVWK